MGDGHFIKLMETREVEELMRYPDTFTLMTLIAKRARWGSSLGLDELEPGEALIGDFATIGLTRRRYRTSKERLEKANLASFRATNKGTVAKILDSRIYDIFDLIKGHPEGQQKDQPKATQKASKRPARGQPKATNIDIRDKKLERKSTLHFFDDIVSEEPFPQLSTSAARAVYEKWTAYRKKIKKPLTETAVKRDCQNMTKVLNAGGTLSTISEAMDRAEYSSWTGWFFKESLEELSCKTSKNSGDGRPAYERMQPDEG